MVASVNIFSVIVTKPSVSMMPWAKKWLVRVLWCQHHNSMYNLVEIPCSWVLDNLVDSTTVSGSGHHRWRWWGLSTHSISWGRYTRWKTAGKVAQLFSFPHDIFGILDVSLGMVSMRGHSLAFLCTDVRPGLFKANLYADHTGYCGCNSV